MFAYLFVLIKESIISQSFVRKILFKRYLKKWRKANSHNRTTPSSIYPLDFIKIGVGTYGKINVLTATYDSSVIIGNYCSIADEVTFVLNAGHPLNNLSTYPFKAMFLNQPEATSKGNIRVGDDVWIGYRAIVMSGVTIGQGAVIAAGAVVTKDIPPYSVVAGVPAKIIKYRFDTKIIDKLLNVDFKGFTSESIINNIESLYTPVNETEIDRLIKNAHLDF